jgi:hypothetical protein
MSITPKYFLFLLLIGLFNEAQAELFSGGQPQLGKALVEKHCIQCHAKQFGGDGSKIYTREDRIVKTSQGLLTQVRNCNTMIGLQWFEDEELHATSYLNNTYYHFVK